MMSNENDNDDNYDDHGLSITKLPKTPLKFK
jgi:hypothetical protein